MSYYISEDALIEDFEELSEALSNINGIIGNYVEEPSFDGDFSKDFPIPQYFTAAEEFIKKTRSSLDYLEYLIKELKAKYL